MRLRDSGTALEVTVKPNFDFCSRTLLYRVSHKRQSLNKQNKIGCWYCCNNIKGKKICEKDIIPFSLVCNIQNVSFLVPFPHTLIISYIIYMPTILVYLCIHGHAGFGSGMRGQSSLSGSDLGLGREKRSDCDVSRMEENEG